jgi:hypothetical protein
MNRVLAVFLFSCLIARGQTSVTLNGVNYQLKGHPRTLIDGPGGVLDSRIKDPDGPGPLTAPKAVASNPAWVALGTGVRGALTGYQAAPSRYWERDGTQVIQFAAYWYGDNSQTAAHDAALDMLNHIEYYLPLLCVETSRECDEGGTGYGVTSYGLSYWIPNWIMAYELMRGEMTSTQRQAFADKMLNDNAAWGGIGGSPSTSCSNASADAGTKVTISYPQWSVDQGTLVALTVRSGTLTATITGNTAGLEIGSNVLLAGGPFNNTFPILAKTSPTTFTFGFTGQPDGAYASAGTTLTYQVPYASTVNPVFGTAVGSGDWIFTPSNTTNLGVVDLIVDANHAFLTQPMQSVSPEEMYYRPRDWSSGQCGFLWAVKHDEWAPTAVTGPPSNYPPTGGMDGQDGGHNLVYSALWGLHLVLLSVADDDVNGAARSGHELTVAFNWWYANQYATAKRLWTGFHQSGSGYGLVRTDQFLPGTAMAVQSSVIGAPDLMGGVWSKNLMTLTFANTFPNVQRSQMQWGQPDVSGGFGGMNSQNIAGFAMLAYWFRNTNEGQYANWWLRNLWSADAWWGNTPGTNLGYQASKLTGNSPAWLFIFTDQAYPVLSLANGPTTFPFNVSDTGIDGQRADGLISRTGYLSLTDTVVNFHAESIPEFDHNVFAGQPSNYGSYKIYKGHYLLAEDYGLDFSDPAANGFTAGGTGSNYIEVGGTVNNLITAPPIASSMPRAAGSNSYAYGMADVTRAYTPAAGVQHAYRHLVDFKKPGTQQFIVDYVDFQTTAGKVKKAYYHYANKDTTTLASGVVTSTNSHVAATQLLTKVLAPQPVAISTDTTGGAFRVDVCPSIDGTTCDGSNTQAEMLVVHMPVNGTSNNLPPVTTLGSIDANFVGVEVDGSSPKIAVLGRKGQTYTSTSFTAAHTGTAQILIGGISPTSASGKVYTLLKDGASVMQNQQVGSDGTIYYEGLAGAYQLVAVVAPPKVATSELADASQYVAYSDGLSATAGTLPLSWSIIAGSLPLGLTLDTATGAISGTPTGSGPSAFTVQVTDALGSTDTASLSITVGQASPLLIQTSSITGKVGIFMSLSLLATGGGNSFTWSLGSGVVPEGISLQPDGLVSGTTMLPASGLVTVIARDAWGNQTSKAIPIAFTATPATFVQSAAISGSVSLQ